MPKTIIISGPTAAGKTAKSLELARKLDAEIISCDSIQVYKHMDIGSAKPSPAELAEIPHHLINMAQVDTQFNVGDYVELAKKAFDSIRKKNKTAIVVGGSGFYLQAWFSAVTDEIFIPEEIKKQVAEFEKNNTLLDEFSKRDPEGTKLIDIKNPRRLKPTLERIIASGLSTKELQDKFKQLPCPMGNFEKQFICIDLPNEELFSKVKMRTEKMLEAGLIKETKKLLTLGIEKNPSAAMAVGYRETISAIKENNYENLAENISKNTLALIKKQRKFFKRLS